MNTDDRRLAFVKALLAAAWADGELRGEEIRTITEYLQRFEISAAEYENLRPLLEMPLSVNDAQELLEEQLLELATPEEQGTLVAAIGDLLLSDDDLAPSEADFLRGLRELTGHVSTPPLFVSRLRALWSSTPAPPLMGQRTSAVEGFLRRRLLEYFRGLIGVARARAGLDVDGTVSDADLYRAVIWAALLTRVAHADNDFCSRERERLGDLLGRGEGDPPEPDLSVVLQAYEEDALADIDLSLLVREFVKLASNDELSRLLDCLFLVAAADDKIVRSELEVIHEIAIKAGFPESAFTDAYERCKRRMESGWN